MPKPKQAGWPDVLSATEKALAGEVRRVDFAFPIAGKEAKVSVYRLNPYVVRIDVKQKPSIKE